LVRVVEAVVIISEVDMVIRVASATLGASEVPAKSNRGPYVERVLAGTHTPAGKPWCAAWVTDVGTSALGQTWPVPRTASVQAMAEWAESKGVRYVSKPKIGDLFCLWFPELNRYAHVGLVTGLVGGKIVTVEGNTSGAGERDGWLVASKTRTLGKMDRLIRWVEALP
jgi:hypothetical protein